MSDAEIIAELEGLLYQSDEIRRLLQGRITRQRKELRRMNRESRRLEARAEADRLRADLNASRYWQLARRLTDEGMHVERAAASEVLPAETTPATLREKELQARLRLINRELDLLGKTKRQLAETIMAREPASRSEERRLAVQRGEEMP